MTISGDDIIFVYSGGGSNADPSFSLGGDPSARPINDALNNLFNDVSETDAANGLVDYRCFYVFNDNSSDTFYSMRIFLSADAEVGNMEIGVLLADDIQQVSLGSIPTGGSLTLNYDGSDFTFAYDSNPITWASNFQTALNSVGGLTGAAVAITVGINYVTFRVSFSDADGNRNHQLLTLVTNGLTGTPSISISKVVEGGPINYITNELQNAINTPTDAVFDIPTEDAPFTIGNLKAGEGFPVWIKRTTPEGSAGMVNDGFTFEIDGEATA